LTTRQLKITKIFTYQAEIKYSHLSLAVRLIDATCVLAYGFATLMFHREPAGESNQLPCFYSHHGGSACVWEL
jgi:hypothetical protein